MASGGGRVKSRHRGGDAAESDRISSTSSSSSSGEEFFDATGDPEGAAGSPSAGAARRSSSGGTSSLHRPPARPPVPSITISSDSKPESVAGNDEFGDDNVSDERVRYRRESAAPSTEATVSNLEDAANGATASGKGGGGMLPEEIAKELEKLVRPDSPERLNRIERLQKFKGRGQPDDDEGLQDPKDDGEAPKKSSVQDSTESSVEGGPEKKIYLGFFFLGSPSNWTLFFTKKCLWRNLSCNAGIYISGSRSSHPFKVIEPEVDRKSINSETIRSIHGRSIGGSISGGGGGAVISLGSVGHLNRLIEVGRPWEVMGGDQAQPFSCSFS